ncbi:M24 family metallopeptidase [Pseudothermotoga elfii]|uniref:M24 family metallopeptidase n=1 Tax=Pseudothermotoga elfii TaxID=38322 RepID=UPI001E4AEA0E|nr:Xaa-Pro peptidase family protein [Pseudothermotoga elfii]
MQKLDKLERFFDKIEKAGVDVALIYNVEYSSKPSTYYLSNFTGSFSVLLINREKQFIITDSRYFEQAKQQTDFKLVEFRNSSLIGTIHSVLNQEFKAKTIGLEFQRISHSVFEKLSSEIDAKFVPIDSMIDNLREVKDEREIELIKKAVEISERAFLKTIEIIKDGITEKDIAAELEYNMKKSGADGIAFETIVISGPRTSLPHGRPSNRKISLNEPILFDFGASFNGYCADITRTIFFGKPDDEFRKVYQTVYDAQSLALQNGNSRMTGKQLDFIAREHISKNGYGQYFGHGLGHGIGIEIHESPRVSSSNENLLPAGSVVTIEPGIYLEGKFGVRIEEDVVVRSNALEKLTNLKRELITI